MQRPGLAGDGFHVASTRLVPHYPIRNPLEDLFRLVPAGTDAYLTEKFAFDIERIFQKWGEGLKQSRTDLTVLGTFLDTSVQGFPGRLIKQETIRSVYGIEVKKRQFEKKIVIGKERFQSELLRWLAPLQKLHTTEFEIFDIAVASSAPLTVNISLRYDVVASTALGREERTGTWKLECVKDAQEQWKAISWATGDEMASVASGLVFGDVSPQAFGAIPSYREQMLRGVDEWRTSLDGACGIDVYSNNGVSAGDYDNDGFDDFYISQPAGLPNRLYHNRGDGTFDDVTEKAGVGVLDNTACALFADFENRGLQDLLVVCGTGPLLFQNRGNGTFQLKREAFRFANAPQGTFTHAAIADYDGDGRLDVYFCMYMYYLGLDQYHYPVPYYDARNGPPNSLLRNQGDGTFIEVTKQAGLDVDNDRYSFACAWGDSNGNGVPDLLIANDFGSSQLYRNNGDGTFKVVSKEAQIEDVGAGMSACWSDYDNDGRQDIYITSMWEAAGQRVSAQNRFHEKASPHTRELFQRHARGNALYHNDGNGKFQNVSQTSGVAMGRWSWSSDFWDFDHDGYPDLYVTNGYISSTDRTDLASFFWRQVVANSPDDASPSQSYERGWNAINEADSLRSFMEFIRTKRSVCQQS